MGGGKRGGKPDESNLRVTAYLKWCVEELQYQGRKIDMKVYFIKHKCHNANKKRTIK